MGVGGVHAGACVLLLVNDLGVRVISEDGGLLRLSPWTRQSLPSNGPAEGPGRSQLVHYVSRQLSGYLARQHCALGRIRTGDTRFRHWTQRKS